MNVTSLPLPTVFVVPIVLLALGRMRKSFLDDVERLIFALIVASLRIPAYIVLIVENTVINSVENVMPVIVSKVYALIAVRLKVKENFVNDVASSLIVTVANENLNLLKTRLRYVTIFAAVFAVRKRVFVFIILMNKVNEQ